MLTHNKLTILGVAGLLLAALPAVAAEQAMLKSEIRKAVVISNTGSTNTTGYKIYVLPNGSVWYTNGRDISASGPIDGTTLPETQVKRLFKDIAAAMPLTSLPVRHGMKSASFGTSTYISYKGQKSPELTFAADPRAAALKADIVAITKTLGIGNSPRRPLVLHLNKSNTN